MALNPDSVLTKLNATAPEQIVALGYLKNEVIGHIQKKEEWVRHGILRPIVRIVAPDALKTSDEETRQPFLILTALTDEDNAKLQALQLLASFANAGPAFLPPLHAAGALPAVLSSSCLQNGHHQIVLAALRVVRDIAEAAAYAPSSSPITSASLADALFTESTIDSFYRILSQRNPNLDSEAEISIVTHLIKGLCHEERHQSALVDSGILDALATKLASFAVAQGQVLPSADIIAQNEDLQDYIPAAANPASNLDGVLGAISSIIGDSPFRASKLLFSPSILAIFPIVDVDFDPIKSSYSRSPTLSPAELPGLRPTKHPKFEPMSSLLPQILPQTPSPAVIPPPNTSRESINRNGRSSVKFQSNATSRTPSQDTTASNNDAGGEEAESPLIPWLIDLVRSRSGSEMLMAASILTSLFKAGFSYKIREANLGLLVVPVLLGMLNDVDAGMKDIDYNTKNRETASMLGIIEQTPAVLARLITDSELLQKAAFDCNAIKIVCKLLKDSYESPPPLAKSWSWSVPNGSDLPGDLPPDCCLGEEGQHRFLVHRLKVRESTLRAIGSLATFKDEYRKAVLDQDVIHYVVESLDPTPDNPVSVVLAACYAVRMLSRSVNILRTALVDHAVSKPLLRLLRHHDVEVRVAATGVMCNLVLDVSPMRDSLVEDGILKILCEHAHSHNASLRLNALWALKHLVHSSSIDLKKRCVEELESGWLVRLICDDTEDDALYSAKTRSDREAAQDTLDDIDEDIDMGLANDQHRPWLSTSFYKTRNTWADGDIRILELAERRLEALREAELSPVRKARQDDLNIQEQGLGFIRNLIGGDHSSGNADSPNDTTEMIDFLFTTLGQDRLFEILASKLRVKVLHPFSRRGGSGSETRILYPQPKIIESVIYILVHIAASIPRHRQLVVSQTELLKQLATLFNNNEREVRVALCHLINNLTWQDNASDGPGCSQRAHELKKLGFLSKLEALKEADDELDVRERAKSALWQMKP